MSNIRFTLPKNGGLMEEGLPQDILHSFERIPVDVYDQPSEGCISIADEIVQAIREKGGHLRIGLSTGSSPRAVYKELVRRYRSGDVSFADVEVFSIDEYYPNVNLGQRSRNFILHEELLDQVDFKPENIHIPDGAIDREESSAYCAELDRLASDLDLLVMGIGSQGQIGFNDPGARKRSRTRIVMLSYSSRIRQAKNFKGNMGITPKYALTLGIGTMRSAKRILLIGWGENKAKAVKMIAEGEPDEQCPASLLQNHDNIRIFADKSSAELLTRYEAPWLVGPCEWTPKCIRKAVIWLCQKVGKPILKLTQSDYLKHSLGELLEQYGPYDKINIDVFNDMQHTISGWPGGKPNADDSTRPVASIPFPKKILIFSPHPDDDVISMGGTFIRLAEQGHDVHVAYQTSGNVAVHDDVVLQLMDATHELEFADKYSQVKAIIDTKRPGQPEPRELLRIKGAIRRSEARSAVRSFGLDPDTNAHFLNLPFYETGGIKKSERTQKDIDIIIDLLQTVQPDQIYAAGDLADPHGTHRVCTEALLEALRQLQGKVSWLEKCHLWLYRGAWMEWDIASVDMAVPISPDEVIKKRHAIFRHLSQKDIVPFPGEDSREFWQRAEERTQHTANLYNALGMAEYQAMEVFLRLF